MLLNLEKSTNSLVLSLQKAGIIQPPVLDVGVGLDVSKSFEKLHNDGVTNALINRLVPWGLAFDPDKKIDLFTFSNGAANVCDVGPVDASNYEGVVKTKIINKVTGWNGGTDYSYLLEKFLSHFGWLPSAQKMGFLGRMMGKKPTEKKRSVIIVATDGDNYDKPRTIEVLKASEARKDEVYVIFLGISNQGSEFPFLERIGDQFGNTAFVRIPDLRKFVEMSDDEINAMLIEDELIQWLKR